jgi:AcrR family transcriptional regulator
MARSGSASRPMERSTETRRALVKAAIEVLRSDGFAKATARAVAARAGCNQSLVFYHFGSVVNLLLAALDEISTQRRERYQKALAGVSKPSELVDLAARVFSEDLDTGDAALLVEMIAGANSTPGLGAEVKARVEPWTAFAALALESTVGELPFAGLAPPKEIAHAVVALYLGLELLSHLDGDRSGALALFDRARKLASLADLFARTESAGTDSAGTESAGTESAGTESAGSGSPSKSSEDEQ